MNRDVIGWVTLGDLTFLGSAVLAGLVVSFVVRAITNIIKGRLRRGNPDSIRAT